MALHRLQDLSKVKFPSVGSLETSRRPSLGRPASLKALESVHMALDASFL